jgi:hypothetical protein
VPGFTTISGKEWEKKVTKPVPQSMTGPSHFVLSVNTGQPIISTFQQQKNNN